MAKKIAPTEVNIDDWNDQVMSLGLNDTSNPSVEERRLFLESGRYVLKIWNGSTWKEVGELTANDLLTMIKTVDGAGSGLNADHLDGFNSTSFIRTTKIQCGTASIAYRTGSTTVTFSPPFSSTPKVILTAGPVNTTNAIIVYLKTVTTTSFSAAQNQTSPQNCTWIAYEG